MEYRIRLIGLRFFLFFYVMDKLPLLAIILIIMMLSAFSLDRKPRTIVFFGDSITEAGIHPGGYIARMQDSLAGAAYTLEGAGVGGDKIYDLYLRLEMDVLAKKPQIVVVYVGVNDVWHKQLFGTGTDPYKFIRFYGAIIEKLQKKGIKIILCTPACIGEKPDGMNPLDAELDQYSDFIRTLAVDNQLILCDLRAFFKDYAAAHNPDLQPEGILTTDGVHLNTLGNQLVAEHLLALLP